MKNYQTRHVAKILDISASSVRKYADTFLKYFSDSVNVPEGKHRKFSPHDLDVMNTIVALLGEGQSDEQITAFLDQGQVIEAPQVDDKSLAIATGAGGNIIAQQLQDIEDRLSKLESDNSDILKQENEALKKEIRDLYMKLGIMKGKYEDS
jgi:DNA-binding transcriptional MerR regulator